MKQLQQMTVVGFVVLGAFACSSEVPIGEGLGKKTGALGAVGQSPKPDGTCDVRLTVCAGTCHDLGSENANCGSCANACIGTDTCVSGACEAPAVPGIDAGVADATTTDATTACAFGHDFCGGACIDILFDANNCGACGVACGAGKTCVRATCM